MAVCRIIETTASPDEYDKVRANVGLEGSPPPGARFHIAATGEDGKVRIVEVWDSRDEAERFTQERVRPAREQAGLGQREPTITYLEVHNIVGV